MDDFEEIVKEHRRRLRKRNGQAMAEEHMPPVGQALLWYEDVIPNVPACGRKTAHQLARLCGDDSKVITTYRALADAVAQYDKTGAVAYIQRGIRMLKDAGWLTVVTVGQKRAAHTTFFLEPGQETDYKKIWDEAIYADNDWANHYVA